MNYLLDTCVISELTRPEPTPSVKTWLHTVPSETVFLSVITIGELRKGIVKLPESQKKARLTWWLDTLLEDYHERILACDLAVAEAWGHMQGRAEQVGTPMSTLDGLIAATASIHQLIVVTRNERDFLPSHLSVLNPWKLPNENPAQDTEAENGSNPLQE